MTDLCPPILSWCSTRIDMRNADSKTLHFVSWYRECSCQFKPRPRHNVFPFLSAIVHGHGRASTVSVSGAFSITRCSNARHDSQSDATVAGCDDARQCSTPRESLGDRETWTNRVLNCYWMRSSVKPLSFATLAVICTLGDGLPLTSVCFLLVTTAQS